MLDPTSLGAALASAANPLGPSAAEITAWTAIANALITHIKTHAVVLPSTLGVPTLLTGASAGAPVVGTGSIS